jgi:hypothetical protein
MSLAAIFFFLYGLGQILFFNIGTGIGFLLGGCIFVWAVVRRI